MGRWITWTVRVEEATKTWWRDLANKFEIPYGEVFDRLRVAFEDGIVTFDGSVWRRSENEERQVDVGIYEREIAALQTKIKLYEAKIKGLEEQNTNSEKISGEEKGKHELAEEIKLNELINLAQKRRITPQSLLDAALRPYRC